MIEDTAGLETTLISTSLTQKNPWLVVSSPNLLAHRGSSSKIWQQKTT